MAFDLDNEELRATRKLHKINDDLYEETSDKNREKYTIRLTDEEYRKVIENAQKDITEQKDKIIKELEEELEKANRQLDLDYVDDNYIPKQKIEAEIQVHINYLNNQATTSNPTLDKHFREKERYVIQVFQKLLERESKDEHR